MTHENRGCRGQQKPGRTFYYNIEGTENPYILKYTEVAIENLSDRFKITEVNLQRDYESRRVSDCVHLLVDKELLTNTLREYKELLLADRKKSIRDELITHPIIDGLRFYFDPYLQKAGLQKHRDSDRIVLARAYKPRAETNSEVGSQYVINTVFKYSIQSFVQNNLGFEIKLAVSAKTLYNMLTTFKKLFPTTTYGELVKNSGVRYGSSRCEELWNDPELAKLKPKVAKKEKA